MATFGKTAVIFLCFLVVGCSSDQRLADVQNRLVGSWHDKRVGTPYRAHLQLHLDGSITSNDEVVGNYEIVSDQGRVHLSFQDPESHALTLTLVYDDQAKTDTLIVNPDEIPHESARMPVFEKAGNGSRR